MDVRRVYVSDDSCDVYVICSRLLDHGIRENRRDSQPFPSTGAAGRVEVWAAEQDADRAECLLIDWKVKPGAADSTVRRLQFSLLGIFVVITLVAVLLGTGVDFEASQIVWVVASVLFWFIISAAAIRRWYGRRSERN